jgi:hypothetical protein
MLPSHVQGEFDIITQWILGADDLSAHYEALVAQLKLTRCHLNRMHWKVFETHKDSRLWMIFVVFLCLEWLPPFLDYCVQRGTEWRVRAIHQFMRLDLVTVWRGVDCAVTDPKQRVRARVLNIRYPTWAHFTVHAVTRYLARWDPYGQFRTIWPPRPIPPPPPAEPPQLSSPPTKPTQVTHHRGAVVGVVKAGYGRVA